MRRKFLFALASILFFYSFSFQTQADQAIFNTVITQKIVQEKSDPRDFSALFYGLVISHEQADLDYEKKLASLFFTQDLFKLFKNKKSSCVDYRVFTGAQDIYQGFWLGKVKEKNKEILLPIYLEMNDAFPIVEKSTLSLKLVKTAQGWKIDDFIYAGEKKSLREQLQACS